MQSFSDYTSQQIDINLYDDDRTWAEWNYSRER